MWLRHLLGFMTLLFLAVVADTEFDDYMPLGSVLFASAAIYLWFILSSKMTANWWIGLVLLLAALYLIDIYETREEKKREMPVVKEYLGIAKNVLVGISLLVTLAGFIIYIGEKKLEYKGSFNYGTFLLGTPTCKNTPNKTPYWDSLRAAFLDKPWTVPMKGGDLDAITTTLLSNPEFQAVSSLA